MNKIILFALCTLAVVIATSDAAATKFTTKYDNVNLDEILTNERLFSKYLDCIMEKPDAKCTPDGIELKRAGVYVLAKAFNTFAALPPELQPAVNDAIPEAIKSECAPCSDKQKEGVRKVMKFLHDKKPKDWEMILSKYDPQGTFRAKYQKESDSFFKE